MKVSETRSVNDHATRLRGRVERAVERLYAWLERNRITRYPWAVIQTFSKAQGALLAGSVAYYMFLSLFPLIMVATAVLGTVSAGRLGLQHELADAMERLIPGVSGTAVVEQLVSARVAFGLIGLITLAYAGSGFVGALTACMNRMWQVPTGRNPLGQKLLNLTVILLLGIVLLGSVGITIWASALARSLFGTHARATVAAIELLGSPVALFVVLVLLYRALPAMPLSWRSQVPGAALSAVAIEVLKRAFVFWADHSAGVAALPRSVISIVLLMVWLGFFGQIILYGAAFNVVRSRKQRGLPLCPPPTSVSPARSREAGEAAVSEG